MSSEDVICVKSVLITQYTNNETVFSSAWTSAPRTHVNAISVPPADTALPAGVDLTVMTGQSLRLSYDPTTGVHSVTLGNQTAQILRPDIVLENGVLHVSKAFGGRGQDAIETSR